MEFEIRKYLRLVERWWWLLLVSAVIPMAASYYFVSQQPSFYQAKATIIVGTSVFLNPDPDTGQMSLSNTLAAAYAEIVRERTVTEAVIERIGLEKTPEQLAAQTATNIRSGAQFLEIYVTDTNPEAAALMANALADELIRRSPASGGSDPQQQEFVRNQMEELQDKILSINGQIDELTASLSELTSAAEIQEAQERIDALEQVKTTYQTSYADLINAYRGESPNVLSLFEPALVPQWPIPSKTKLIVAVAGAAGLGLALSAVLLMEYLDTSLQWEGGGVQSILELPILGAVPRVPGKRVVLESHPSGFVTESLRAMRANIFLMHPDRSFKTLLLTSPGTMEGKSFVLANLAVELAAAGNRVIAVDADMRRPALHELFDQPNLVGLAEVLGDDSGDGEEVFSVPLQETCFDNLFLLSAGQPPADPVALLTSPRLPAFLEFLGEQADVVLIDSPPVVGPPDASVVATLAEGTILVVSVGVTKLELIRQAADRLTAQQGVNLLGLAVNRAKLSGDYLYRCNSDQGGKESKRKGKDSGDGLLTLGEAANRLGISIAQARRWCKSGRLSAVKRWPGWRVDVEELDRTIESMREAIAEL